MNREYLYESIGELVDALLERTEQKRPANRRRPWWLMAATAVLVVAPVLPILPFSEQPVYAAICEAEYPRMAPNPNLDRPFLFVITSPRPMTGIRRKCLSFLVLQESRCPPNWVEPIIKSPLGYPAGAFLLSKQGFGGNNLFRCRILR